MYMYMKVEQFTVYQAHLINQPTNQPLCQCNVHTIHILQSREKGPTGGSTYLGLKQGEVGRHSSYKYCALHVY